MNRGADWSDDLLVVANAALATMTINSRGTVRAPVPAARGRADGNALPHDAGRGQLGRHVAHADGDEPELHRRLRAASRGRPRLLRCVPRDEQPRPGQLLPQRRRHLRYQHNTSGTNLRSLDGTTNVGTSVDPFFFKVQERDCVVITDRSTFGKDEIDALLHLQGSPAFIPAAFYVVLDGFRASDLGITPVTLTGTPNVAPAVAFNPTLNLTAEVTACTAEDPDHLNFPQRFTWTYHARFTDISDFTQEIRTVPMTASMTSTSGITVSGQAVITLTLQPNPYEIDGPTSWLSVDLQVFELPFTGALPSTPGIVLNAGPNDFITRLLANSGGGYNDPALARAPNHPFDLDLVANQDSSVVSIGGTIGFIPVYNFAVARVRYRALSTPAPNVRAFFRLFQCSTTSTNYQPASTYLSGGQGGTKIPLLGVVNNELVSIPCFAAPRVDPASANGLKAQTDPANVGPVGESIPADPSGNEVQVYFGCWLDINQTTHVLPAAGSAATGANPYTPSRSVQDAIRGQHQCLVAEINLDPPEPQIATGASPATSDKLAQRNLTIVGVASPHEVPATFEIKPTSPRRGADDTPDELMIDWGRLPAGSTASIYLPGADADEILATAERLYLRHSLSRSDAHTLRSPARGITYIPIPSGSSSNYAGLLTVEVPVGVKRGQVYDVVTRQLRTIRARLPQPPPPPPEIHDANDTSHIRVVAVEQNGDLLEWRRVVGAFQLSIPVETRTALLPVEERLLSVLRWIARSIPTNERWFPIFQRYLKQVGDRVKALGGDPEEITPSSSGEGWRKPIRPGRKRISTAPPARSSTSTSTGTGTSTASSWIPATSAAGTRAASTTSRSSSSVRGAIACASPSAHDRTTRTIPRRSSSTSRRSRSSRTTSELTCSERRNPMSVGSALRARIEAVVSALGIVTLVLTLFWKDWIEAIFGVDPDRHNGFVEWVIAGVALALSVICAARARANRRVARRPRPRRSSS